VITKKRTTGGIEICLSGVHADAFDRLDGAAWTLGEANRRLRAATDVSDHDDAFFAAHDASRAARQRMRDARDALIRLLADDTEEP
jgi:hypothetical protein